MWRSRLEKALQKEVPYSREQELRLPDGLRARATESAVLILCHPLSGAEGDFGVLLTKRSEQVAHHKGQISFPGGVADPEDFQQGSGLLTTALREAEEEIGLPRDGVEVLGTLPPLLTVTGFRIHPFVGVWQGGDLPPVSIRTAETEIVFWAPYSLLCSPGTYRQEWVEGLGRRFPTDVFYVDGHRVWGATGSLLRNFVDRLNE